MGGANSYQDKIETLIVDFMGRVMAVGLEGGKSRRIYTSSKGVCFVNSKNKRQYIEWYGDVFAPSCISRPDEDYIRENPNPMNYPIEFEGEIVTLDDPVFEENRLAHSEFLARFKVRVKTTSSTLIDGEWVVIESSEEII